MYERTSDCESKSVVSIPNNEMQYQQLSHTYVAEHHCRVNLHITRYGCRHMYYFVTLFKYIKIWLAI